MPGLDLSAKLRRALGKGQIAPREAIAAKMVKYDSDDDGALLQHEFSAFLKANNVGGRWFCDMVAKTLWNFCTTWYSKDVTWIKIDALAWMLNNSMRERAQPIRRYKITPEGAMGYVPLEPMEGSRILDSGKGGDRRAPAAGSGKPKPGAGAPRSGAPRRGPGPRRGPRGSGERGPRGRARPGPRGRGRPGPRRPGPRS